MSSHTIVNIITLSLMAIAIFNFTSGFVFPKLFGVFQTFGWTTVAVQFLWMIAIITQVAYVIADKIIAKFNL